MIEGKANAKQQPKKMKSKKILHTENGKIYVFVLP